MRSAKLALRVPSLALRGQPPALFLRALASYLPLLVVLNVSGQSAQPIGSVSTANATVANRDCLLQVTGGRVVLAASSTVTAKNHTADIHLARGGTVGVCRSSVLHLTAAAAASGVAPLLLAIDRGALEVRMQSVPGDVLLTPDLRFTTPSGGPLDLALNVTEAGDTCVDNRGSGAPVLDITDAFGEISYRVKPGQHVTFEHGDLHAVVDRETTPCGCPSEEKPGVSIAEALLASHGRMTPAEAEAVNPFPAAVSSGLAEPAPLPPETGETHVQVATTLNYDPAVPSPASKDSEPVAAAPLQAPASVPAPALVPASASVVEHQKRSGPLRAIGHFFKRLFVR